MLIQFSSFLFKPIGWCMSSNITKLFNITICWIIQRCNWAPNSVVLVVLYSAFIMQHAISPGSKVSSSLVTVFHWFYGLWMLLRTWLECTTRSECSLLIVRLFIATNWFGEILWYLKLIWFWLIPLKSAGSYWLG